MKKMISLLGLICFTLSGCKDYIEVENLTIVTAIAVDKYQENQYKLAIEVVKFSDDKTDVTIVEAVGVNFLDAMSNAVKITGNDLYLSHAQAIIISEEVAKDSIYQFIDYAYRNTDFRLNIPFLVAKDTKALEILKANSLIDDIAGVQIKKIVDSNELISEIPSIPIYEFIDDLTTEGDCGILPVVTLKEENDEKIREISGLALFDNEYIYGYLDAKQTKTLGVLLNKSKTANVINEYDPKTPAYNMVYSFCKINPVYENDKLRFTFDLKMKIELCEQTQKTDISVYENQMRMQEEITVAVKKDVLELIEHAKISNGADFFGLGNMVYRKYPSLWKQISGEFEEIIRNLDYTLNVECEIVGSGLVSTPIYIE